MTRAGAMVTTAQRIAIAVRTGKRTGRKTMADYISREAALAFQDELAVLLCKDVVTGDVMSATKDADLVKYLLSIPAADVRPVVRGKWIPDYDYTEYDYDGSTPLPEPLQFQDGWQCGLCGEYTLGKTNFCPNCGADMREES